MGSQSPRHPRLECVNKWPCLQPLRFCNLSPQGSFLHPPGSSCFPFLVSETFSPYLTVHLSLWAENKLNVGAGCRLESALEFCLLGQMKLTFCVKKEGGL